VVEDEDLLGDGVNVAARLKGSMSAPVGTESRHLRKASEFFNSLLEQQSVQVAGSARLRSAPPAPIAQAVRKGARSDFLGDRALPITCRRSSPRT
jgi:class 3 adenylate cyclase